MVPRQPGAGAGLCWSPARKSRHPRSVLNVSGRAALTETDVALAVADGEADCGLAIGAVAHRFGLDFVPLHRERFDMA